MSADAIDGLIRVAGAVVLLSSFKMARGGGLRRVRDPRARRARRGGHREIQANGDKPSIPPKSGREVNRYRIRPGKVLASLGIMLLLLGLYYLALQGEVVLAELDDAFGVLPGAN